MTVKTPKNPIQSNIHDCFIKNVLLHFHECRIDFFRLIFTPKEFKLFDWDTLEIKGNAYITKNNEERRTDIVFSVSFKSQKTVRVILLIEHKSYQDPKNPQHQTTSTKSTDKGLLMQLLKYQTEIYRHEKGHIIPVVIYHGRQKKWIQPRTFQDSRDELNPDILEFFGRDILNFSYRLLNTHDLRTIKGAEDLLLWPFFCIISLIWILNEKRIAEVINAAKRHGSQKYKEIMRPIVLYIRGAKPQFTWDILSRIEKENVPKEYRIMRSAETMWDNVRESALEEGMEKGREKERKKVVLEMLKNNLDIRFICKCTGLTQKEVQKLKND